MPTFTDLSSVNLSLVYYADDILNLSRTLQSITESFGILGAEYQKVGLEFISFKSIIVVFNWKTDSSAPSITLGSGSVQPIEHLMNLGLPIASSIRHTRELLLEEIRRIIPAAYASIVSCKLRFTQPLLGSLCNVVALPYIVYTAPFWKLLTKTDKGTTRFIFRRFAKYLLRLPPWYRNSLSTAKFKVADPDITVARRIAKHNRKIDGMLNDWSYILKQ